jgi:hypothetical protein
MSILTKISSRIFILSYETLASYGTLGSHKFLIPSRHYLDSRPLYLSMGPTTRVT